MQPTSNAPGTAIVMHSWRAMRTYQELSKTTSETMRNTHIDHIIPPLQIDFQINAVRTEPSVVGMRHGFIFSQFDEGKVKAPICAWFEALERSCIELRQDYNGRGWFWEPEGDWRGSQNRQPIIIVKGEETHK